eukprot:gene7403-10092_t
MSNSNPLFEIFIWSYERVKDLTYDQAKDLIIHAPEIYWAWWMTLLRESPLHLVIETGLILFIVWLMFIRQTVDPKKASRNERLSSKEEEWLLDTWQPDALVPKLTIKERNVVNSMMTVTSVKDGYLTIKGINEPVLNVGSFDFLGIGQDPAIKEVSRKALEFYGCGSCGPRGFYGTIDQHLFFEEAIAKFMGTQQAISYSDSASAVSSAIPAFAKKGDLLLVDEACGEAILTGCNLSRSTVHFFQHNNINHLRSILESVAENDRKFKRQSNQQRRFIVVEGLYRNMGDICPLTEILQLKDEFCYRLILDETLSFGTLGKTGKGLTEYYGVDIADIEIITLAMDTTLGSVGGVCIGSREVVDHQRLSGAGYCFSASAPPFLSAAAIESLKKLEENGGAYVTNLNNNIMKVASGLKTIKGLELKGKEVSPVIHLVLSKPMETFELESLTMIQIAKECTMRGVAITASKFSAYQPTIRMRPSITFNVLATLSDVQITKIISVINDAAQATLRI